MTKKVEILKERANKVKADLAHVRAELEKLRAQLLTADSVGLADKIARLQVQETAWLARVKQEEADLAEAERLSNSPEAKKAMQEIKRLEGEAEQAGRKISKAIIAALKDAEAAIEKTRQADRLKSANGLDVPFTEILRLVNFMAAELHNIDKAGRFAFKEYWGI